METWLDMQRAGDLDDCHMAGGSVSWLSKKQPIVALSTAEAEYVALSMTTQEAVWVRHFLSDLTTAEDQKPKLFIKDNNRYC